MSDRYVVYRAVPVQPCAVPGVELRIRTYGGSIPPALDNQYRRSVQFELEANEVDVEEIAVADLPWVDGLHHEPVHGFVDVRGGVAGRWRNAVWSEDGTTSCDPAAA